MTAATQRERGRVTRMLRTLRAGDRVRVTERSASAAGTLGTVLDPEPFVSDGVRRVRVRLDGEWADRLMLPASIEEVPR